MRGDAVNELRDNARDVVVRLTHVVRYNLRKKTINIMKMIVNCFWKTQSFYEAKLTPVLDFQ